VKVTQENMKKKILANTYGAAFPLKMELDRQIISNFHCGYAESTQFSSLTFLNSIFASVVIMLSQKNLMNIFYYKNFSVLNPRLLPTIKLISERRMLAKNGHRF
ncbi:cyclin-B1-2-like, partial [Olea europaea subsp. europaea]